jgi:hypothetical protein
MVDIQKVVMYGVLYKVEYLSNYIFIIFVNIYLYFKIEEGILPFDGMNDLELPSKILNISFPEMKNLYSKKFKNIIERILTKVYYII